MKCFECDGRTEVLETIQRPDNTTRRRRQCLDCGTRFTTAEFEQGRLIEKAHEAMSSRRRVDRDIIAAIRNLDRRKAEIAERALSEDAEALLRELGVDL